MKRKAEPRPRIPTNLADRIDKLRGDVPFETWVRRRLEEVIKRLERR